MQNVLDKKTALSVMKSEAYYTTKSKYVRSMIRILSRYQALRLPVCVCIEFLLISSTAFLAAGMRFSASLLTSGDSFPDIPYAFLSAFVCQICMYYTDLYDLTMVLKTRKLCLKLMQSVISSAIVLSIIFYIFPHSLIDHEFIMISMSISYMLLILWRVFYRKLQKNLKVNILILGTAEEAEKISREILSREPLAYEIKGFLDENYETLGTNIANPKVMGSYAQLPEVIEREGIDKVVVALSNYRGTLPVETLLTCKLRGIAIEEGATFYEQNCGKIMLENLRPSWFVFSQGFSMAPHVYFAKRCLDIFLSIVGLLLAAPFMVLAAILIKIDTPGPVFYKQQRVGQNGRLFTLIKFRSMRDDAEALTGPMFADAHDPRVTRVGRLLRTTRVDELPQLLNVLKGEMSFVGPRPERPCFVERFARDIPFYAQRLSVKPGITGWAQVHYPYGATLEDAVEKLRWDLYYMKHVSIHLDLFILMKTVKVAVLGEGAR